jgi:hypothetical protein
MKNKLSQWTAAVAASLPLLSAAQATPQLSYRSAFADFRPYQDVPLADWRAANDAVAPAPRSASTAANSAAPGSAPAAAPGHHMHQMPAQPQHHRHGGTR